MNKPIKRSAQLAHFSHDHHDGLLLCWKIRTGLSRKIDPERIHRYAKWFYINHLIPHFEEEEKILFPILGKENDLVMRALDEHADLKKYFLKDDDLENTLQEIARRLDDHIRFEERILFGEIEAAVAKANLHIENFDDNILSCEDWDDKFWENPPVS